MYKLDPGYTLVWSGWDPDAPLPVAVLPASCATAHAEIIKLRLNAPEPFAGARVSDRSASKPSLS
jgi:hypothetical protein